ncbi:alpha-1,2-fucosyltransferase [Spirosoma pollinicola]|uniref:Alpha-1,2-fucosyltransferase n=1 Tax=Spirosoma pollinicola TaxID=2057025 RepID=A0A2K8YS99_9BACT|nr:alpha-1,2-fucosyltransferase [Spirosoma pollinicola]AUD00507.1 alpha-1,2-fucosyltransferase [Spirosoma pollinicola]
MVIGRITSGLGNQLFQYAAARHLALKNKTALYLDLSYYLYEYSTDTVRPFKLGQFAVPYKLLQKSPMEYVSKATKLLPNRSLPPIFLFLKEKQFHFDNSVIQARANCITLEGFWQSEAYFRDSADTIRRELTLNSIPSPEFEQYQQLIANTPTPVSIHIRRGDYVNHPEFSKTFGFVGIDYYKQALQELNARHENARLFVFSDDHEWVHQNLALPDDTVFVQNTGPNADVADMMLMSHCRHHIIANSSFSWWGAWLNPNPAKLVISPRQWYKQQPTWNTKDLLPATWLAL